MVGGGGGGRGGQGSEKRWLQLPFDLQLRHDLLLNAATSQIPGLKPQLTGPKSAPWTVPV